MSKPTREWILDERKETKKKLIRILSNQVTEQVRKAAMVWKANREKTIEREEAITNAREKWETLKCSEVAKSQLSSSLRDLRFEEIIPLNQSLPLSGKAVQLPQRAKRIIFSKRKNHSQVCIAVGCSWNVLACSELNHLIVIFFIPSIANGPWAWC